MKKMIKIILLNKNIKGFITKCNNFQIFRIRIKKKNILNFDKKIFNINKKIIFLH